MSIFGATVSACVTGPNGMVFRPLGMRLVNKEFVSASMKTRRVHESRHTVHDCEVLLQ